MTAERPRPSPLSGACRPLRRGLAFALFGLLWPALLPAADVTEKLKIFGYLTQAYGESDRGSIQGATEGGTTDLRKIAIQFRWEISETDTAVVQLAHERRGNDFLFPKHDELEVDWAFYEKMFTPTATVKVGRLNVPLGIYNEVRDVGTLLPFFNLPISFYAGVLNSAETVDGVSLTQTIAPRSDWSLEVDLYYGGWDTFQQQIDPTQEFGIANVEARAEDGLGLQLWLDTPIDGLRIGGGALTWLLDGPHSIRGTKDRWDAYHLSLDANLERWMLRAEFRRTTFDQDFAAFLGMPVSIPATAEREGFYVQLGVWITPQIGLFGQHEEASLGDNANLFPQLDDLHEDTALSINYRIRSDLLIRAEFHSADTQFPLGESGVPDDIIGRGPVEVEWAILAFSVSF